MHPQLPEIELDIGGAAAGPATCSCCSDSAMQASAPRNLHASMDVTGNAEELSASGSSGRATRKRPIGDFCALTDDCKNAPDKRRAAASSRDPQFRVGDAVGARFKASQGGTSWFRGTVSAVHEIGFDDGRGPRRIYDIAYNDGDSETAVLSKHVREPRSDDVM